MVLGTGRLGESISEGLSLAHLREARDDVGIVITRRVVLSQGGSKDRSVAVDGVVRNGMAKELQMDSNLMCTACQR